VDTHGAELGSAREGGGGAESEREAAREGGFMKSSAGATRYARDETGRAPLSFRGTHW